MRILAIGDVIGGPGRDALLSVLPRLRATHAIDVVVANAENAAGGLGTTGDTAQAFLDGGVDVVTGGNHTWKHREFAAYLDREPRALRPLNYGNGPGSGARIFHLRDGRPYAVVNLIGRTFMQPVDNPFAAADAALSDIARQTRVILVDMHAEATSEKRAMGWHLDGRVSAVWGTHQHVPTADEEILPDGTAYLTDVGMTGPYASVIGLDPKHAVQKFVTNRPSPYRLATGNMQVRAALIDIDDATGRARTIERITERRAP